VLMTRYGIGPQPVAAVSRDMRIRQLRNSGSEATTASIRLTNSYQYGLEQTGQQNLAEGLAIAGDRYKKRMKLRPGMFETKRIPWGPGSRKFRAHAFSVYADRRKTDVVA